MRELDETRQLLTRLLSGLAVPELGARLKQRLNTELTRAGAPHFDERAFGFRKFSDFLEAFPQDFEVVRPNGPGDVQVRLRAGTGEPRTGGELRTTREAVREIPRVQNDAWQAFTNPDPHRRRFVHRVSGRVLHFIDEEDSRFKAEVTHAPEHYVEVRPVPPGEQLRWMREYVDQLPIDPPQANLLRRIAEGPYSSDVNTVFSSALGEYGVGWRRRRAARVFEHVEGWAHEHRVPLRLLVESSLPEEAGTAEPSAEVRRQPGSGGAARERVLQLLAILSEEEVEQFVLPLLLTTVWTTTRKSK